MDSKNINTRLHKVVADCLGVDIAKVTSEATFESLGADSLDRFELIIKIEDEFGIDIAEDNSQSWEKVGDVEAYMATTTNK